MPTLDIRTLCLATGLILVVIAAYLAWFRSVNHRLVGADWWALGAFAGGVGLILVGQRELWPDWSTVVLANLLIGMFAMAVLLGLYRFLGIRFLAWRHAAWLTLLLACTLYWTYVKPSVNARIVMIAFFVSAYCLPCVWLMLFHRSLRAARWNWLLVGAWTVTIFAHWLRAVWALLVEGEMASLMDASLVQGLSLLVFPITSFIIVTGLVFLSLQRMADDLRRARDEVRQLSGLLPICASCKRIRDDRGYWHQVEQYIQSHSGAEFTHGICPECMRQLYPRVADRVLGPAEETDPPRA